MQALCVLFRRGLLGWSARSLAARRPPQVSSGRGSTGPKWPGKAKSLGCASSAGLVGAPRTRGGETSVLAITFACACPLSDELLPGTAESVLGAVTRQGGVVSGAVALAAGPQAGAVELGAVPVAGRGCGWRRDGAALDEPREPVVRRQRVLLLDGHQRARGSAGRRCDELLVLRVPPGVAAGPAPACRAGPSWPRGPAGR